MTIQDICEDIVLESVEDCSIFAINEVPVLVRKEHDQIHGVFQELGGENIKVKFEPRDFIKNDSIFLRRIDVGL